MLYLEQLPDHGCLEHRPDTTGRDDECVRSEYEVMETRKESSVFEREFDEGVHFLLKRQINADADRLTTIAARQLYAFVCRLHQTRPAAGDDIATHFAQRLRDSFRFFVGNRPRLSARSAKNCDAISIIT